MFQYDGNPRKNPSSVFASTCEKPYALASRGRTRIHERPGFAPSCRRARHQWEEDEARRRREGPKRERWRVGDERRQPEQRLASADAQHERDDERGDRPGTVRLVVEQREEQLWKQQ